MYDPFFVTCQAILFDLDGVLIDSNDLYEAHWRTWASNRGVSFSRIQRVHHGRPIPETIRTVAPHLDPQREAQYYIDGLIRCGDWDQVRPYGGAAELLHTLPAHRWAIVTSAPREVAIKHLNKQQLPIPGVLVTGDDVSNGKPAPDPWWHAARELSVPITQCIVIEDAPAGIKSAKLAGAHVIALTTTNSPDRLLEANHLAPALETLVLTHTAERLQITYRPSAAKASSTAASV